MKFALVIPDGCADEPQASLGGRTPLQAARTPHMDEIARLGIVGRADTVPASMTPGSDVGTMSLFGYDPLVHHTGRAPIEAAAQGIGLGPDDWAIRCNLVTIEDGVMRSFTAGQIPSDVARELIGLMQQDRCGDPQWKFHAGVSYRNLLVYRGRGTPAPFAAETATTPPHDVTDKPVAGYLPSGPGSEVLRELMDRSVGVFAGCEANQRRRERGELQATGIWLWGLGKTPSLEPFAARFGKSGAVITAVDLLRGLGRLVGWQIIDVPGATGYLDTDYAAKGRYAIDALVGWAVPTAGPPEWAVPTAGRSDAAASPSLVGTDSPRLVGTASPRLVGTAHPTGVDLIVVHVEATDEASHEGDAAAKVAALERIDADIVGPLHAHLQRQGPYRMLVSPDHPTFLRTRTHSHGAVPFAMCGSGVTPDAAGRYDEATAAASQVCVRGHELMPLFLDGHT